MLLPKRLDAADGYDSVVAAEAERVVQSNDGAFGWQLRWLAGDDLQGDLRILIVQVDGHRGLAVVDGQCAQHGLHSARGTQQVAHLRLGRRNPDVVELIAQGQSNKLIARQLNLSPHTVKRHIAHAMNKLNVNARSQLAAWFCARA